MIPSNDGLDATVNDPSFTPPRSAYDKASGLTYFPRMLDKMRLKAGGRLHSDYHANLGGGADGWCCQFLRVRYEDLRSRTLAGGTDEEILQWCGEQGRLLEEVDLMVWNAFVTKLGWRDFAIRALKRYKTASGLGDRDDLETMVDYFDVDEGRKP
ncbi:MAG: DUF5069 domain-containing protein [Chthoniobacteraceae bacterium]